MQLDGALYAAKNKVIITYVQFSGEIIQHHSTVIYTVLQSNNGWTTEYAISWRLSVGLNTILNRVCLKFGLIQNYSEAVTWFKSTTEFETYIKSEIQF